MLYDGYGFAFVDLETGGTSPNAPILEIAIIFTDNKLNVLDSVSTFIGDSKGEVSEEAEKFLKFSASEAREKGITKNELIERIKHITEKHNIKRWIPVAWHIHFDIPRLERYLREDYRRFFHYRCIDAPSVAWYRLKTLKSLSEVAKMLGIEVDDRRTHRALYDAELMYRVLKEVLRDVDNL